MRKSAQNLPSFGSRLDGRESNASLGGNLVRSSYRAGGGDKDSMLSLFMQIGPDKLKSQLKNNKESHRS